MRREGFAWAYAGGVVAMVAGVAQLLSGLDVVQLTGVAVLGLSPWFIAGGAWWGVAGRSTSRQRVHRVVATLAAAFALPVFVFAAFVLGVDVELADIVIDREPLGLALALGVFPLYVLLSLLALVTGARVLADAAAEKEDEKEERRGEAPA